jgi:hypothetical protein
MCLKTDECGLSFVHPKRVTPRSTRTLFGETLLPVILVHARQASAALFGGASEPFSTVPGAQAPGFMLAQFFSEFLCEDLGALCGQQDLKSIYRREKTEIAQRRAEDEQKPQNWGQDSDSAILF